MSLCVDHVFVDAEGYTCADYGDASAEECAKAMRFTSIPIKPVAVEEASEIRIAARKNCRYMLCLTRDN
jgi:hypothetical protein